MQVTRSVRVKWRMLGCVLGLVPLCSPASRAYGEDSDQYIRGRVIDIAGSPVPGARVYAASTAAPLTTEERPDSRRYVSIQTDPAGSFVLHHSLQLRRRFSSGSGRIWASDGVRISLSYQIEIDTPKGLELNLVLAPRGAVRILVKSADGSPAAGVGVHGLLTSPVIGNSAPCHHIEGETDGTGVYRTTEFPSIAVDDVLLRVSRGASQFSFSAGDDALLVNSSIGSVTIEARLPRVHRVMGRLLYHDGEPAAGCLVVDRWPGAPLPSSARYVRADPFGRFVLGDAPAVASLQVRVHGPEQGGESESGVFLPLPIAVIDVPPDREGAADVGDVTLPRLRDVLVTVLDVDGRPAAGAVSVTWPGVSDGARSTRLDRLGSVSLPRLPEDVDLDVGCQLKSTGIGSIDFTVSIRASAVLVGSAGLGQVILPFVDRTGRPRSDVRAAIRWSGGASGSIPATVRTCSEMRLSVPSGRTVDLVISPSNGPPATVTGVTIRPGGPTIVPVVVDR